MAERSSARYSAEVLEYLRRICDDERQSFACQAESAEEV